MEGVLEFRIYIRSLHQHQLWSHSHVILVMCGVLDCSVEQERFRDLDFLNQLRPGLDAAVVSVAGWWRGGFPDDVALSAQRGSGLSTRSTSGPLKVMPSRAERGHFSCRAKCLAWERWRQSGHGWLIILLSAVGRVSSRPLEQLNSPNL